MSSSEEKLGLESSNFFHITSKFQMISTKVNKNEYAIVIIIMCVIHEYGYNITKYEQNFQNGGRPWFSRLIRTG